MSNASERLASDIMARLVSEGLILPADGESLTVRIARGEMRSDDWRLAVEKASMRKEAK